MFNSAEIYTKEHCPNCHEAISLLKSFRIDTTIYKLDEIGVNHDDITVKIVPKAELLGRVKNVRTVPQVFLNGEYVGGLNELRNKLTIEP